MAKREIPNDASSILMLASIALAEVDVGINWYASLPSSDLSDVSTAEEFDRQSLEYDRREARRRLVSKGIIFSAINFRQCLKQLKNTSADAVKLAQVLDRFEKRFPGLRDIRNSFAHSDERALNAVQQQASALGPVTFQWSGSMVKITLRDGTAHEVVLDDSMSAELQSIFADAAETFPARML